MRRRWWSHLPGREFTTRLPPANSPLTRSFLKTTDATKSKSRPPTLQRMSNFIADGSGSIGSHEPRYYRRGSPQYFWKQHDSNRRCFDFSRLRLCVNQNAHFVWRQALTVFDISM